MMKTEECIPHRIDRLQLEVYLLGFDGTESLGPTLKK